MSGLKTGAENDSFWSEIRSGFGEPGGTPPPRIPRYTPPPPVTLPHQLVSLRLQSTFCDSHFSDAVLQTTQLLLT